MIIHDISNESKTGVKDSYFDLIISFFLLVMIYLQIGKKYLSTMTCLNHRKYDIASLPPFLILFGILLKIVLPLSHNRVSIGSKLNPE